MNIVKLKYPFYLVVFILFLSVNLYSQNLVSDADTEAEFYKLVEQKYGLDQILLNGKYFENLYVNDLGHPYFSEDEFKNGYLIIRDRKYENISLKFNIFDQTLVVLHTDNSNAERVFIPPVEFISAFSIDNHCFKKYGLQPNKNEIYEEIYLGEIKFLCLWKKVRSQSEHKQSFMAHKFSEQEKEYFLLMEDRPYGVKNKNALLRLFPDHKKQINAYIKEHNIKLYKSSDEQISKLLAYCEALFVGNENATGTL